MLLLKINSNGYCKFNISFVTMTTTSELNALDHSIFSAINRIRGQNKRADRNNVHKEIIKAKISKSFLDGRINMLIQNDKIINRLNRNKDSFRIVDNDFNSSITDVLPKTQNLPHFYLLPIFLLHVTKRCRSDIHLTFRLV